jgi:hypothetical protein
VRPTGTVVVEMLVVAGERLTMVVPAGVSLCNRCREVIDHRIILGVRVGHGTAVGHGDPSIVVCLVWPGDGGNSGSDGAGRVVCPCTSLLRGSFVVCWWGGARGHGHE